ncbi:hypothetical protein HNP84_008613 [Thermocatellispora tengchongensis]|uniref:Uncharacterized protein n=1 Tax=Thermocatellispora tengchongensis TaxID=1073253 RepID=A0A840PSC6_9ACTN|nr:hypothetical protein [Thermocatellispora tengchongensis]MBB5138855.1 hypothetical protein [Thermocatellispora tengchongensis]
MVDLLHSHGRLQPYASVLIGAAGTVERLTGRPGFVLVRLHIGDELMDGARRAVMHVDDLRVCGGGDSAT